MTHTLPTYDKRAPATDTEEGLRLVAGRHGLSFLEGDNVVDSGLWYEIQYARWDHKTRKLVIIWVDPDRPPITLTTVEKEPKKFLKRLTYSVDRTIVSSQSLTLPSGAVVTASARRRADGEVFTTLLVRGNLGPGEEAAADALEAQLRRDLNVI